MKDRRIIIRGFAGILILILIVAAVAAGGAFYLARQSTLPLGGTATQSASPTPLAADETVDWKTYTSSKRGFSIKYPKTISKYKGEWEYREFDDNSVMFRPSSIKEDYLWVVNIYSDKSVEELIGETGNQFSHRGVERKQILLDNMKALLVTVATKEVEGWISKTIYLENNGRVFAIGDGATREPEFDLFYNSFKLTK